MSTFKEKVSAYIDRAFLKSRLRRMEKRIKRDFDRSLSYRIDCARYLLETGENDHR